MSGIGFSFDLTSLIPSTISQSAQSSGTKTTQRQLSPDAINSIIYQIMSSDEGLAQITSGQNLAGGSSSSTATLQAQDLVTKVAGQIAQITAPLVETATQQSTSQTNKKISVICTELVRQGKLSPELYARGEAHFYSLPEYTVSGYQLWAHKIVPHMARSEKLSKFFLPIVVARYKHISHEKHNLVGALTVYIGQPVCYLIGAIYGALNGRLYFHA